MTMMRCSWLPIGLALCLGGGTALAAQELLQNGGFEGKWRPLTSNWDTGTAEGEVPEHWEDVSTWSGASTRYTKIEAPDGAGVALRLELVRASKPSSVLQLRSSFDVSLEEGRAYAVSARLRSSTNTRVELDIRQHEPPRIRFWRVALPATSEWRQLRYIFEPTQSGSTRFFVAFREPGIVEVDGLSLALLADEERPPPQPPVEITTVRCVATRGDLIRHSDIIAMYQEGKAETLRKYLIDVVAWGGQLRATEGEIAKRRELIEMAHGAGVRMHAVDCAMVQEGGKFVVAQGDRSSPGASLFWQLRKDNEGTIKRLEELGVDLTRETVLNISGDWIGVPWLRKRWRIPMASVYSPAARKWFFEHMEAIAATGANALHFDEPAMGSYGVLHPSPGDFSDHAMTAFRDWLRKRPEETWKEAGVESLEEFDYREFVLAHGGVPKNAPLWREFVRFQLFTTVELVRELRDRVREKAGHYIPLSMNANASSWIKLPFLELQDYMTTEVAHQARGREVPTAPLLVYKLGDTFQQPVASTAHGHDWYEMKTDQHPILVSAWLAMGYALGHHLMMPCKAWVMDPVKGSDTYRPDGDHYACMARFIKAIAELLDGHETLSTVAVVIGCDAIERDSSNLNALAVRLADANIPFCVAVEGNDLLEREVRADDLAGCCAVVIASPAFLPEKAIERVKELAGDRPVAEHHGGGLPGFLPRPIGIDGAEGVWVLPRMVPGDAVAPVAVHLLNRDYDAETRAMRAKGPFTLRLDDALFGGRRFTSAKLHQPRLFAKLPEGEEFDEVTPLETTQSEGHIELTIPGLELWGVVELR